VSTALAEDIRGIPPLQTQERTLCGDLDLVVRHHLCKARHQAGIGLSRIGRFPGAAAEIHHLLHEIFVGEASDVGALAGRSPSYLVRQLYDMQRGNRNGVWTPLMASVVAHLGPEDLLTAAAYLASLKP
jgi:hypothetical protein